MTFEILALLVADDLRKMMQEDGFETFSEMRKSYMWDSSDIRDEICYSLKQCGGDCYDDLSMIESGYDTMPYRIFKKMVMKELK